MSTYSTYEAKAKFSEILRKVRAGQRVVIAYHGEEVAEIRPIEKKKTLAASLRQLEEQGILGPLVEPNRNLAPVVRKEGALASVGALPGFSRLKLAYVFLRRSSEPRWRGRERQTRREISSQGSSGSIRTAN
jgi:prevent-host-death family protein